MALDTICMNSGQKVMKYGKLSVNWILLVKKGELTFELPMSHN